MSVMSDANLLKETDFSAMFEQAQFQFIGQELVWLPGLRTAALKKFLQQGFPSRHQENWKYTDLTFVAKQKFAIAAAPGRVDEFANELFTFPVHRLVFIDGHFSSSLSSIEQVESGVLLLPLSSALGTCAEKIKPYLEQQFPEATASLANLNTAFFSDGMVLWVPKNIVMAKPIHLLFLSSSQANASLYCPRNIVVLEENSQAVILEQHAALAENHYYKNSVTQIEVFQGASLALYKIQAENAAALHTAVTDINQYRDSKVVSYHVSLGGKLARDDLGFALREAGASCQLRGLYIASGQQHVDHHTRIDHCNVHGSSDEYYKGILSDQATGVFNGKVVVHPGAQHTRSQQTNKNILLSKTAEMNTKPELEIYADDVQCTHGATVGQIDDEALFYLRSRGLDEQAAVSLLTQAFSNDILNQIPQPEIAQFLQGLVKDKLI